jgi:hypothetical protein
MSDATSSDSDVVNSLLDAARMPTAISASAIALAASGLVTALVGVQNLTLVTWIGNYYFLPLSLVAVGVGAIFVAAKFYRARAWALVAAMVAALALTLGSIGFVVVATMSGVFSPLAIFAVGGAVAAIVLTALAIAPFRRLRATRRRLRDHGFDLDL